MSSLMSSRPPPASRFRRPLLSTLRGHPPRSPPALQASPKVRERVPDGGPRGLHKGARVRTPGGQQKSEGPPL